MKINDNGVKKFRKKYDITQDEMAKLLYTSRRTIQNWEADKPIPESKLSILRKMYQNDEFVKERLLEIRNIVLNENDDEPFLSGDKEVIVFGKDRGNERMTPQEVRDSFSEWDGLPMYNEPITASFVATYRDSSIHKPQYYLYDPRFRDCNFGAIITGDSMHSEIRHGDYVACKEIIDYSFIAFGEIYYVVAKNGLETCKYVARKPKDGATLNKNGRYNEGDYDEDYILLVPYNKSIDSSPLHRSMIERIYKVRGIVRGY